VIRGGGDLGSACALRLARCGFPVLIAETAAPLAVRRAVSFSEAVYDSAAAVEEMRGVSIGNPRKAESVWSRGEVAVLVDPDLTVLSAVKSRLVVDATMSKRNQGMTRELAPATIALGPGFEAGVDVDAVVETNRGPDLGRVIWSGSAQPNTHQPAEVAGIGIERVLRAPVTGTLTTTRFIGEIVDAEDEVARVGDIGIQAPFHGLVRGLLRSGSAVREGQKIGDLDPRLDPGLVTKVSDKALAVAGGVLEATLILLRRSWPKA